MKTGNIKTTCADLTVVNSADWNDEVNSIRLNHPRAVFFQGQNEIGLDAELDYGDRVVVYDSMFDFNEDKAPIANIEI